jgi:hypothetical protein
MVSAPGVALAAEDSDEKRLFIGFSLHSAGVAATAGTFVMSGRFEGSGNSAADQITLVQIDNTDRSPIERRQTRHPGERADDKEGTSQPVRPHDDRYCSQCKGNE